MATADRCQREGDNSQDLARRGVPDYRVPGGRAAGGGEGSGSAEKGGGEDAESIRNEKEKLIYE